MQLVKTYLNRTPNKEARTNPQGFKPRGVILHETAGFGTLEWNLRPDVRASFNYLILRTGLLHHYVDERAFVAWHAGVNSSYWLNGINYKGSQINRWFIGCELEGANDGTPITRAQQESLIALIRYFNQEYGIPIEAKYYPEHKTVAPGYKSDARGYDGPTVVGMAVQVSEPQPLLDLPVIGVAPSCTLRQFKESLKRHSAPVTEDEATGVYALCERLQVDPAFLIAMWKHEGGSPFGASALQQLTKNPLNITDSANPFRKPVAYAGKLWVWHESFQLGLLHAVWYLKNYYGSRGLDRVSTIIPVFAPASDGNNVLAYIRSVVEDMRYIAGAK